MVALVVGAVFHQHLLRGWTFPWDFLDIYTASPAFVATTAGRGHWTEWVPFVGGGSSLAVDPQSGLYFPLWWLLGAAQVPLTLSTLTTIQVLHVGVGALGVASLARSRNVPDPWALLAGVAYAFFGGFYGQAEHADYFRGFAYAPWLLFALTPPQPGRRWRRLLLLPLMAWLVAAGAYPGQLVAFALMSSLYVGVGLAAERGSALRRRLGELAPAAAAAAAVSLAVVLPYLMAVSRGDLHRVSLLDAGVRAANSWHALDWFGLYLNNFAWTYEGTIPSWGIGVPAIVGVACVSGAAVRRHAPLVATGVAAGVLAALPAWIPAGELMARMPLLFPSRFPAGDYKVFAALALLILASEGWRGLAGTREGRPLIRVALVSGALVLGVLLVPATNAPTATAPWLVVAIVLATAALASVHLRPSALAIALLLLVVADGTRMTLGYRHRGGQSPWRLAPHDARAATARARDRFVRRLDQTVMRTPRRRPARVLSSATGATDPAGIPEDASGYVGDAYRLSTDSGSITTARLIAAQDSRLREMVLGPWMAWTSPCGAGAPCADSAPQPLDGAWRRDPRITTTAYGLSAITYRVDLDRPALMMENELSFPGWSADHGVRRVDSGGAFRTWALPAGRYRFTASYRQPERAMQLLLAALALVAWAAAGIVVLRQRATDSAS